MVDQDVTNKSIIAFNLIKNGRYLSNDELKAIYDHMCLNGHKYFPKYDRISTGQPVAYDAHSFLRLALGSLNVRGLIDSGFDMSDDYKLIDVIEEVANEIFP